MSKRGIILFLILLVFFISACDEIQFSQVDIPETFASNTPTITYISSNTLEDNQDYTISGSGFGIKSPVAPLTSLNSNIEQSTSGAIFSAPNWEQVSVSSFNAVYTNSDAHSGSNSIFFNYNSQLPWSQIRFDSLTGYNKFYVTTWLKFIKNDNCNPVQWKNWRLSSSPGYSVNDEPTTTEIIGDHWVNSGGWGNGGVQCYYNGGTMGGPAYSIASDAFIFDQWQRIEQYYQRSSAPSTADGVTWIKRIGRPGYLANVNSFITHDADDGLWRYLRMGQAYFYDGCSSEDAQVYYDDIYIDNTLARVEICNNQNISLATQCEIQLPHTTWNDGTIQFTANQGSFGNEQLYLFVIDANGNASTGYPVSFGTAITPVCGNTIIEIGETCDDGNLIDGDGCSATCQTELYCGDETCNNGETCSTCSQDCGDCSIINILKNPSFEIDNGTDFYPNFIKDNKISRDRIPDGWVIREGYPSTIYSDTSVLVTAQENYNYIIQYVPIEYNFKYKISGYVKALCTDLDCFGTILTECFNETYNNIWSYKSCKLNTNANDILRVYGSNGWEKIEFNVSSNNINAKYLGVICYNTPQGPVFTGLGTGQIWCDNLSVEKIEVISKPNIFERIYDLIFSNKE